jgi:hypothetical protein
VRSETLVSELNESVLSLMSGDSWQSWLRARKKLHSYSLTNMLLILRQKPEASMVAGRRRWIDDFNRYPKKGTAIWIWGPMRISKKERARLRKAGEDEPRMRFRPVFVFDVGDTFQIEGKPEIPLTPPGEWGTVDGDVDPDVFADLAKVAVEHLGITRIDAEDLDGAHAYYRHADHSIALDNDLVGGARVSGLAHELAHHVDMTVLDQPDWMLSVTVKVRRELIAESAAFLVSDMLGVDTSAPAANYLAAFASRADDPAAALSAVAGRVLQVAQAIEGALAHVRPVAGATDHAGTAAVAA